MWNLSPNLRIEIGDKRKNIKTNVNECIVTFKNGSTITAINASQNVRGKRAHLLIVDEYRMIPDGFTTLNQVLKPFLNVIRVPKFKTEYEEKYKNYPSEENKEIYLSSAWFQDHWSYDLYKTFGDRMIDGKPYFTCNLPYQLSAYHGLLTKERVKAIVGDENMSPIDFEMEFCAQFWKQNEKSLFKVTDVLSCRKLYEAWYPPTIEQYAKEKRKIDKSWDVKRLSKDEIRVLSCDIALMSSDNGKDNDLAVFSYLKCIPKDEKYKIQMLHQSTFEGFKARQLALEIKRLFADGDMDYIVLDVLGNGLSVLDELGVTMPHIFRNEYIIQI